MSGDKIEREAPPSAKLPAVGVAAEPLLSAAARQAELGRAAAQLAGVRDALSELAGLSGVERIPGLDVAGGSAGGSGVPSASPREVPGYVPSGNELAGQEIGPSRIDNLNRESGISGGRSFTYQTPDGRQHQVRDTYRAPPNETFTPNDPVQRDWTSEGGDGSRSSSTLSVDAQGNATVVTKTIGADGSVEVRKEPHDPNRHPPVPPQGSGAEPEPEPGSSEPPPSPPPPPPPSDNPAGTVTGDEPGGGIPIELKFKLPPQEQRSKKLDNDQVNPGRSGDGTTNVGGGMRVDSHGLVVNPSLVDAQGLGKLREIPKSLGPGARPPKDD